MKKLLLMLIGALIAIPAFAYVGYSGCGDFGGGAWSSDEDALVDESTGERIYDFREVKMKPEFPGGDAAMYEFLYKNLYYPPTTADIQGTVILQFIIDKDGSVTQIKVARTPASYLSDVAVSVVELMPKWTPGRDEDGEPIKVLYTLPMRFLISRDTDPTE